MKLVNPAAKDDQMLAALNPRKAVRTLPHRLKTDAVY